MAFPSDRPPSRSFSRQVRQLAAVELRKRISQNSGDMWLQVNAAERAQIKQKLPEVMEFHHICIYVQTFESTDAGAYTHGTS